MINNEIIKSLDTNHKLIMLNLFNYCLSQGIYPWYGASALYPHFTKREINRILTTTVQLLSAVS